jgi:hypothetical protein
MMPVRGFTKYAQTSVGVHPSLDVASSIDETAPESDLDHSGVRVFQDNVRRVFWKL